MEPIKRFTANVSTEYFKKIIFQVETSNRSRLIMGFKSAVFSDSTYLYRIVLRAVNRPRESKSLTVDCYSIISVFIKEQRLEQNIVTMEVTGVPTLSYNDQTSCMMRTLKSALKMNLLFSGQKFMLKAKQTQGKGYNRFLAVSSS